MTDVLTADQRRLNMSRIRSKDTKPEMIVRSLVHRMGYRFRLHDKTLPGKPDLVLKRYKTVIFVHGCFWHMHTCRWGQVKPKTSAEFWENKRRRNAARDEEVIRQLEAMGWRVIVVWECETRDVERLRERIDLDNVPVGGGNLN
jgi:DNA mismatch endonuclease (patch repair protein)